MVGVPTYVRESHPAPLCRPPRHSVHGVIADIAVIGPDNSTMAELRVPNRADLDAVSTEYPIYLILS